MADTKYLALLRWTKKVRTHEKKRRFVDSVEIGDMIYPFSARNDDEARDKAKNAVSTEGSRGGPDNGRVVKIWEIVREVPRTKKEADAEVAKVAASAEQGEKEKNARRVQLFFVTSIRDMGFSVRTTKCLVSADIHTTRKLVGKSEEELLKIKNFGQRCVEEITAVLTELGLKLGMSEEEVDKLVWSKK